MHSDIERQFRDMAALSPDDSPALLEAVAHLERTARSRYEARMTVKAHVLAEQAAAASHCASIAFAVWTEAIREGAADAGVCGAEYLRAERRYAVLRRKVMEAKRHAA